MRNHLTHETSPYLLQHAENPVDWYPWGEEAFCKAKREDKPVFLSIGYSTCHWCHVMAHESFEDSEVAELLNQSFVSIKVDKEERPDLDSIYMAVCQAFTGSGGWPTSIFMTAEQKPFFAGTYFPKTARYGAPGLKDLLLAIRDKWQNDRAVLLDSADRVISVLNQPQHSSQPADERLLASAVKQYKQSYDKRFGGFGDAPKFPAPHNLLFLLQHAQKHGDGEALEMAETTLRSMYAGGLFDHVGYGFCRYSTDRYYLVPHFEKMLYDNALLMLAYCKAYEMTQKPLYREVAEKTAFYVLTEMTSPDGGFYSAQDADSDGEEGKYYVFEPGEIITLLGKKDGAAWNRHYGITEAGNFEGKSIPNLLHARDFPDSFDSFLPAIRSYRRARCRLHTDDKILTLWNALLIAALCALYRVTRKEQYLDAAKKAQQFIEKNLCEQDTLYVSFRDGRRSGKGFLDDYAGYCFALLALHGATLDARYLDRAAQMAQKAIADFFDRAHGGFYLYGAENETLISRPKESYDGAIPSGNSLMAYNLLRLHLLRPNDETDQILRQQLNFMTGEAARYPAGYAMFLTALSDFFEPPAVITAVLNDTEAPAGLPFAVPSDSILKTLDKPTDEYRLLNNATTFYICRNHSCLPPVNTLNGWDHNKSE